METTYYMYHAPPESLDPALLSTQKFSNGSEENHLPHPPPVD